MAEPAESPSLRIYCVCGQKMKVTGSLFGRPGKCIACRQKIRVPRLEEIPEGEDTIYLKDHPEFIRKVRRSSTTLSSSSSKKVDPDKHVLYQRDRKSTPTTDDDGEEEAALGDSEAIVSTVALDVLDPLRTLCSLEYKVMRQHDVASGTTEDAKRARAECEGHLTRIRQVRAEFDEQLRQRLMEVAIELATTQDKLPRARLSARLGEISFDEYQQNAYRLRMRRDRLERQQQNLRGWLATTDVHLAGGFIDLPLDSLPADGFKLSVPSQPKWTAPLVDIHTNALRDDFEARNQAERKIAELERLSRSSRSEQVVYERERADAKGQLRFIDARISYTQDRLYQLSKDYSGDLETIVAQLDVARAKMQSGAMDRAAFDKAEKKLLSSKADTSKALSVVDRALGANSAQDVPTARGTYLGRMGAYEREESSGVGMEVVLGWTSVVLFIGLATSRLAGSVSGAPIADLALWAGVLCGSAALLAMFLPSATNRAMTLLIVSMVGAAAISIPVHQGLFAPALIAALAATATFGTSVMAAQRGQASMQIVYGGGLAAVLLAVLLSLIPGASPQAELFVDAVAVADATSIGQEVSITIENDGDGPARFVSARSDSPDAYQFFVERKIGSNSWDDSGVSLDGFLDADEAGGDVRTLGAGETAQVTHTFRSGTYRVLLLGTAIDGELEQQFTVAEVDASQEPPSAREEEPPEPVVERIGDVIEPESEFMDPEPLPLQKMELELRGIGTSTRGPRFAFTVYEPNGESRRAMVTTGESVAAGWRVATHDTGRNSVTITNGIRSMTLSAGERIAITEER